MGTPRKKAAEQVVGDPDRDDRHGVIVHEATPGSRALAILIEGIGYRPIDLRDRKVPNFGRRRAIAAVMDRDCNDWAATASSLPADMRKILVANEPDFALRLDAARNGIDAVVKGTLDPSELSDRLEEAVRLGAGERIRVILVDDNPLSAELNALILRGSGIDASIVEDPTTLLIEMQRDPPDLLLLDLNMPGIDGIDLARIVRQTRAFELVPIVFLSAVKDLDRQLAARRSGGDDFIGKPIDPGRLVAQVALRVERSRHVRALVERDGLTGLLSHGPFKDRVAAMAEHRDDGTDVTLAMLDIDLFKTVNDTFGHCVGDRVIRTLAGLLSRRLRRNDVVGRYGGEEFGIMMPGTGIAAAAIVVDDLRATFARLEFEGADRRFRVTFSAGLATMGQRPSRDASDLFARADRALYTAKAKGRNRVEVAP